jgi:hypothetical protein
MGMGSGMGGGDPAMASKRRLPAWMNMQPAPGGPGMPMGLLGGGGPTPATSQLYGGQGGGVMGLPPTPVPGGQPGVLSQLTGGGGGAPGAPLQAPYPGQLFGAPAPGGGYPSSQLSTFMNSLGPLPQGGNSATSQLFGGGAPAPGGNATSQFGQFNPASRNFPAYLQNLFGRGRRGNR